MAYLRVCSPGETFHKVSPFLSSLGITRIARQTDLDCIGIPVWCAFSPNARSIVIANGKGVSDDAARTSATMEAIERSVANQPNCMTMSASARALGEQGLAFDLLPELLAKNAALPSTETVLEWAQGWNLVNEEPIWLPLQAVSMDRTVPNPLYWQTSDGLASGNTLAEAVSHGLLERVERDALTLWELADAAGRHATCINLDECSDPTVQWLREKIEQAGLKVSVFDISSNLGIPCVAAFIAPRDNKGPLRYVELNMGAGASPSATVAIARAITEAVQSRMTFIAGARDDFTPEIYVRTADAKQQALLHAPPIRNPRQMPHHEPADAVAASALVIKQLSDKGYRRLYAVDLSADRLPVKVAKVVAPQLENPDGERKQRFGMRALTSAFR